MNEIHFLQFKDNENNCAMRKFQSRFNVFVIEFFTFNEINNIKKNFIVHIAQEFEILI